MVDSTGHTKKKLMLKNNISPYNYLVEYFNSKLLVEVPSSWMFSVPIILFLMAMPNWSDDTW